MSVSCWLDGSCTPRPPMSVHVTADAAVVGAGMTGVGLALFLQRAGLKVLLLDAGVVAGGASGRSVRLVTSGLGEHYSRSVSFWGREDAAAISRLHLRNHEILRTLEVRFCPII